jgi:hypothetical protein
MTPTTDFSSVAFPDGTFSGLALPCDGIRVESTIDLSTGPTFTHATPSVGEQAAAFGPPAWLIEKTAQGLACEVASPSAPQPETKQERRRRLLED